ncbi:polysaccharide deacetylase family protein [Aquisalinus flavus]|nr:polysaccharide deacetylase family protein [Aquisalinus flavus]MBD0426650.1 polysaccharide deacetylase family protein [Aquisalinus flavus]
METIKIRRFVSRAMALAVLAFSVPAMGQQMTGKRIALTYDDAPMGDRQMGGEDRAALLVDGLAQAGVEQAAFFVTTDGIDSPTRLARIQNYAAAGHVIANHSHSHPWLREVTAQDYLADIDMAEAMLAVFENRRAWFRYPFLNEAPDLEKRDGVREGLAQRGLANGYVTVDTYDWYLDGLYQTALGDGEAVCEANLGRLYTDMIVDAANFYDEAARDYLGRPVAHTLLLHENDIAAMFITDLVAALEADGWQIITADEAYEDPIAAIQPDTQFLGMGRVAALASLAGKPGPEFTFLAVEEAAIDEAFFETYDVVGACSE